MTPDISRGVPQHLLAEKRFYPFPDTLGMYKPLMGRRVDQDVTNLPAELVRNMPLDSVSNFTVVIDRDKYPAQIAKAESIPFVVAIKFTSQRDPRYKLEAEIYRTEPFLKNDLYTAFIGLLPQEAVVLKYDLISKMGEQYFPPFRAGLFLPWALTVLRDHKINYLFAEWEPYSDNHAQFYKSLGENGLDSVEAAKQTWTHKRFSRMGFELVPRISIRELNPTAAKLGVKTSPKGNPFTLVNALYVRPRKLQY